jgi:hypothetical protein
VSRSGCGKPGGYYRRSKKKLKEALELFFETASAEEINTRLHEEVYVTNVEVAVG